MPRGQFQQPGSMQPHLGLRGGRQMRWLDECLTHQASVPRMHSAAVGRQRSTRGCLQNLSATRRFALCEYPNGPGSEFEESAEHPPWGVHDSEVNGADPVKDVGPVISVVVKDLRRLGFGGEAG